MVLSQSNANNLSIMNFITQPEPINLSEGLQSDMRHISDVVSPLTVNTIDGCDDRNMIESTDINITETCESKNHYELNDNDPKVMMYMAIGLEDTNNTLFRDYRTDERFPSVMKYKRQWVPNNSILVREIKRRKKVLEIYTKTNLQTKQDVTIDWLVEHPLIDPEDIRYIQCEMKLLSYLMINS